MAAILENIATAVFTVFTLALTLIAYRAWQHARTRKVALLAAGFAVFLAKGILLTAGLFLVTPWQSLLLPSLLFDLVALAAFYLAVFA